MAGVGAVLSEDGKVTQLQFVRASGPTTYINVAAGQEASLVLKVEQALGSISSGHKSATGAPGTSTSFRNARHVSGVEVKSALGVPVLSLILSTGLRMDFALNRNALRDVIACLQQLEGGASRSGAAPAGSRSPCDAKRGQPKPMPPVGSPPKR